MSCFHQSGDFKWWCFRRPCHQSMLLLLVLTRLPCYAGWHRTLEECAALLFAECINSGSPNTGWQRSLPGWILREHVARYKCVHSHSSLLVWYLSQCGPLRWNYCHSWQDDSLQVIKEVMIQKHLADSWATDRFCSHPYQSNCRQHLLGL